ncbi:hypothetical protein IW262DRAFT_473227 [Armillaria fumosa]|nr:hypothetical protein IW262DRAFT_473227 [Armillaria fumosa]
MFRRDDAGSVTETEQAEDTGSGGNASTALPATTDSASTPSSVPVPSSTGRGLVVVETSTPPEPYSFSTLGSSSATDIPSFTIALPLPTGSTSADIPSTTLFYSIVTAPTIAPVSVPPWTILPVSDTPAPSSTASAFPFTSLFYSIVTAAEPSIAPWYSILPVSDVTGILPTSSSTSADTAPESTSLFYSIVTAGDPAPASSATTSAYSILPVSDITTISVSSSSASADTSIPLLTSPFYSIVTVADPTPTPAASILPISDTVTIPTSPSSVLRVPESSTTPDPAPGSTLIYSILPASTPAYSILPVSDTPGPTAVPTSSPTLPGITPTPGPSKSTSNYRIAITTEDTPAQDAYHSTTNEAPTTSTSTSTSSQRINNLALQPTADTGASSTVLVTSGSITRTLVVPPTGGITGVGGGTDSGSGTGPSSGDTPSHHVLLPILGPVLAGVVLLSLVGVFVGVRWRRRRRVARWQRLPYEPALDTSRHSSRFLNPFTDIDDDWSIIASEVERPVSTTTTASTLAFAPSRQDASTPTFGVLRSGGWR